MDKKLKKEKKEMKKKREKRLFFSCLVLLFAAPSAGKRVEERKIRKGSKNAYEDN